MYKAITEQVIELLPREAAKAVLRICNAVRLLDPNGFTRPSAKSTTLINQRLLKLHRFSSRRRKSSRIPVLLIPPLIVNPSVFDLHPDAGLVGTLIADGHDVFLIDFGSPDERDRNEKLDDYVKRVHRAVRQVKKTTECGELSLVGYCLGGIFANIYSSLYPLEGIRNIVNVSAPTNFDEMRLFQFLAPFAHPPLNFLAERTGYIPAGVSRLLFRLTQPLKTVMRPVDLAWNLWDEEFLSKFLAVGRWTDDFVNVPEATFKQFWRELFTENRLYRGNLFINRSHVDLGDIRASYLALIGRDDHIVSPESALAVLDLISSDDKESEILPGGHLGVLIGSRSDALRSRISNWLKERSEIVRPKPMIVPSVEREREARLPPVKLKRNPARGLKRAG